MHAVGFNRVSPGILQGIDCVSSEIPDSVNLNERSPTKMDNLVEDLEAMRFSTEDSVWAACDSLIRKNFVPKRTSSLVRPAEESDYYEYKSSLDKRMRMILSTVQEALTNCVKHSITTDFKTLKAFAFNLLLTIGEHQEKNVWTTAEAMSIARQLEKEFLKICGVQNVSQFLMLEDNFGTILNRLLPKLEGDFKAYPAVLACYKWLIHQVEKPGLHTYINYLVPVTCKIADDYIPDNVVTGLECLYQIIQHCHLRKALMDGGYSTMLFDTLGRISRTKEPKYVILVYLCLTNLLTYMEYWHAFPTMFEWTSRDSVISLLLDSMECEQNVELRRVYMHSLTPLLTSIGGMKWCERLSRILSEYCEHYSDLRTLKLTLQTAKTFLLMFRQRVAAHCVRLYKAFLKLHIDLTETPVLDKEIMQNLEDCICLLYKLSPNVGSAIMNDDRMRLVINNNLRFICLNDTKYFE